VLFVNRPAGSASALTLRTYTVPNVNRAVAGGRPLTKCTPPPYRAGVREPRTIGT
jgi:hypothetical protein